MSNNRSQIAHFHLPGLFEFYELYKLFLKLFHDHREYFYDWCDIGSIYGNPSDCLWAGGRVELGETNPQDVINLMREYGISARLTLSNSLLEEVHLKDKRCNDLCKLFAQHDGMRNGIILHSDLLLQYLKEEYNEFYFVSSTTKVLTVFDEFVKELERDEFSYVVPDFRLNKSFDDLSKLTAAQKEKVEFLCNEACWFDCKDRKHCYEVVSLKNLGEDLDHHCKAPGSGEGYRFSRALANPGFIGVDDILNTYMPMGFTNFKIEGRGLGSALVLEFLLYYMTKPEYQIHVREYLYLDNMLDLF